MQNKLYLDPEHVRGRWSSSEDLRLASTLMAMDAVEKWTFDGQPEIEDGMRSLCDLLDKVGSDKLIGSASHDFIILLAYIQSGRALHMLNVMDSRFGGAGLKLVQTAVELTKRDSEFTQATLMVDRLETLRRIRSLNRIFSPARMRLVIKALQETTHDET